MKTTERMVFCFLFGVSLIFLISPSFSQDQYKVGKKFILKENLTKCFKDYSEQNCLEVRSYNAEKNTVFEVTSINGTNLVILIKRAFWPNDKTYDSDQVILGGLYCIDVSKVNDKILPSKKNLFGRYQKVN
jgi:hypothetical protein